MTMVRPEDVSRPSLPVGPGLVKATTKLVLHGTSVRTSDAVWRRAFDAADSVSEGAVRDEGGHRRWYGSTSLIVPLLPEATAPFAPHDLAARDLHARLRATRLARNEAQSRAPASLGPVQCELRFLPHPRGLRVDVEVEAALIESPGRRPSASEPSP
ncbi:MAG: hypothetical protein U0183_26880 [Polyangiaceae bacterium]